MLIGVLMIKQLPFYMLIAFLCTITIESLIACICKIKEKEDFFIIFLANCLTNPLVVSISFYINIRYGLIPRRIIIILLEIITIIIEGFLYKKCLSNKKHNPFFLSIYLNGSSYLLGILINSFLF